MKNYNVAIAGAGIGGLCAAIALTQRGSKVAVYEKAEVLTEVGAGLQLSPNAMQVLDELGVADPLKALAFAPQAAVMRHFSSGDEYLSIPLGASCKQQYGADYLHIHRADIHSVLLQACIDLGVHIHLGQGITGYQNLANKVSIEFENGDEQYADILLGADGIRSNVQACMLGSQPADFTGQVAWRGTVATEDLPKDLIKPNANLWVGPGKHFVSYYLRGGDLVNFVAVEERSDWHNESWHEAGDVEQLRNTFKGWHPEVTTILNATDACFLWALYGRKPLDRWVDQNVALLGDACHPMLPFLAQGAAMAIEDAYTLAQCLHTHESRQQALLNYQTIRKGRASRIQQNAKKNAAMYHMSTPVERVKLAVLRGLSAVGISQFIAANKLDYIYGYNPVKL
ncbi:FAD-dependent monooxygenase [Paraglaciecola aquimarina]|uniref:FAD-dependent monooxygenase n=1 Tax=Paraglaciecola aquimarina TaxID=1235557 RepID=A0ABU3SY31_9ALTE|nr:FAD-dependent monooxygenase [Paraglaciecola aquimarina]MDU0354916.1 FAD-dependent monooxygenase [Paraglaciecola aquimarina]